MVLLEAAGDTEEWAESRRQSRCRILYLGPRGPTWLLGERVRRQTTGLVRVPQPPPTSILRPKGVPISCRKKLRQGVPAGQMVIADASYSDFVRDRKLLPPVVEICVIFDLVDMHFLLY